MVTVCYNSEREIERTVQSVLEQEFTDFEYIIKDGASSDGTLQKLNKYHSLFEQRNISYYVISEEDSSLYDAMNVAINLAKGQWINFLNAGDVYADSQVLLDVFANREYEADVLYGNNYVEDQFGRALNIPNMSLVKKKMPFNHQSGFFSRELIKNRQFDLNVGIGADYHMVLDFYAQGRLFKYIDRVIAIYNLDGISSTKYVATAKNREFIRREYGYRDNYIIAKAKIIEAYIKEFLEHYCPKIILKKVNWFYKKYVKHYKGI